MKMNIFKLLILSILIFSSYNVSYAQGGSVAAGGEIKSDDIIMSYSVGQPLYTKISQEDILVTQGLQHPKIKLFTKIFAKEADQVSFTVYPNPASENINIELPENNIQDLKLVILSMEGKILIEERILETKHSVAIAGLKPGTYTLLISSKSRVLSSYQILKQ